ncbi:MAG: Txe/YoeB family addiction module toxin [Bacteroidetes bacterium]|nr:Txe/YoeB family addiction module toxin [Bacteroidota bacterium]
MRDIVFRGTAFEDFSDWLRINKPTYQKLVKLIEETRRTPFQGTGNPEPLKHQLSGCWSRKINEQHRLVYMVTDSAIEIVACKFHYK